MRKPDFGIILWPRILTSFPLLTITVRGYQISIAYCLFYFSCLPNNTIRIVQSFCLMGEKMKSDFVVHVFCYTLRSCIVRHVISLFGRRYNNDTLCTLVVKMAEANTVSKGSNSLIKAQRRKDVIAINI